MARFDAIGELQDALRRAAADRDELLRAVDLFLEGVIDERQLRDARLGLDGPWKEDARA